MRRMWGWPWVWGCCGGAVFASVSLAATLSPEVSDVGFFENDEHYSLTPFKNRFVDECVLNISEKLSPEKREELGLYGLGCDIAQVAPLLLRDPQPGLQVLALKLIRNKIVEERELFKKQISEASTAAANSKKNLSLFEGFFLKSLPTATLPSYEKMEADFATKMEIYVKAANDVYAMDDSLMKFEKYYYYVQILGESLHFEKFLKYITDHPREDLRHEMVAWGASWHENFLGARSQLRSWLLERSLALRSRKVEDAASDRELFYWLLSLELMQPETVKSQKKEILSQLRALWVNFPAAGDAQKIRKTADVIQLSREFSPPGVNQMDFTESVYRAKALLKKMDYEGAQKTLRRVWSFDSKLYTPQQAFEAFQLHVKILRYADQRHKIPEVLKSYMSWAPRMYDPALGRADLMEQLSRGTEIARTYWTYVDLDQALQMISELMDLSKKSAISTHLPALLYLRARIMEQKGNREAALSFFEEALKQPLPQDMKVDLHWRYFYLHFEKATPSATLPQLFSLLDRIKRELPGQDDARVFYWQGKVFTLALSHGKNKEAAIKQFLRAYAAEPFSFYSNLAGLELMNLGVTPPDWMREHENAKLFAPIWADFINAHGGSRGKDYDQIARLYHLAKIKDRSLAAKAFSDADKSVWNYLLPSKNSRSSKIEFGQAMAWLRFSLGDAMGGLRVAEVLRMGLKGKIGEVEQTLLYPLPYFAEIKLNAENFSTNPWLAASLIRQESAFNPRAKSFANAIGLMQMIPPVAAQEAKKLSLDDFRSDMLYQPKVALRLGIHHLGNLVKSFDGSWICAVASYNAGQPPVKKWVEYYSSSHPIIFIERISYAETRTYVKSILRNYINYQRIYGNGVIQTASLFDLPSSDRSLSVPERSSENEIKESSTRSSPSASL